MENATDTTFDVREPFVKSSQVSVELPGCSQLSKNFACKDFRDDYRCYPELDFSELFEKHFTYQKDKDELWELPPVEELFSEFYQLENLQELKLQLNSVKSSLNNYVIEDWSAHTRRNDPAGQVQWLLKNEVQVEFATVAWCKFYECLKQYPLVKGPKLNSLHLCEAPGAFIAALNHYLYSSFNSDEVKWNWLSTTLNPYYEGNAVGKMIIDDRFMLFTLERWLFHPDFTGNIISRSNIEHMQSECEKRLQGDVELITADGSIDCVETPDCQEEFVSLLHFAEMCAALSILAEGGCFVLKLFTLFEATTVSKMYLLNCVFEEVHVFKPATSKRGNSENYIICLGFKKQQLPNLEATLQVMKSKLSDEEHVLPMFRKSHIPKNFLLQHEICARRFMNLQINAIQSNISSFELRSREGNRRTQILRSQVAKEFFRRYNIKKLPSKLTVLYNRQKNIPTRIKSVMYKGSYAERQWLKDISIEEQIFMQRKVLNELDKSLCGRHATLLQETTKINENNTLELQLFRGAAFENLRSSSFADVHILLIRQKLYELLGVDPLQQVKSKCMLFSADNDDKAGATVIDLSTQATSYLTAQRDFLVNILDCVLKQKPQRLIFSNCAFLMHLPVSILRILSLNCFQMLTISTDQTFEVTLQHCVYNTETIQMFEKLIQLLQQDDHILCVVDIVQLHCNEFCSALIEFNNLLLLNNCKELLMI